MEALLLSDAIRRVDTVRELQNLINTRRVKSRLLELSHNYLDLDEYYENYYQSISLGIVEQFTNYIVHYPYDRNLKLEFIDVITVLNPESVVSLWHDEFSKFLADMYLNGDVTMDWIVNLITAGGSFDEQFFVQVMNDDNEQEVYEGLMRVVTGLAIDINFLDKIMGKVGSRRILEQYISTRSFDAIGHLLTYSLMISLGRLRLVLSILLENDRDCKSVLIEHLKSSSVVIRKTIVAYGGVISTLASDCGINLVELRDELPLDSKARRILERIIDQGDV